MMRSKATLLVAVCVFVAIESNAAGKRRSVSPVRGVTLRILANLEGTPAGEGVFVEVDGRRVGVTGPDGSVRTLVSPGTRNVRAFLPGLAAGTATVTATPGAQATVTVNLVDGEAVETAMLVIDQISNTILPHDFPAFTMELRDDTGGRVAIRHIDSIQLESAFASELGLAPIDVKERFVLQPSGRVVASSAGIAELRDMLQELPAGPAVLSVIGADDDGVLFAGAAEFSIGRYRLSVTLVAPPSKPNLTLSNRTVQVVVLNTPIDLRIATNNQGRFTTLLPAGTAALDLEIADGGRYYYARTSLTMNANVEVMVPVLNVTDLQQGTATMTVNRLERQPRPAARDRVAYPVPAVNIGEIGCDATVSAAFEDDRETNVARVTVQKGSATVTLQYVVHSFEYPYYVTQQSIYDDVWELGLYAPNGKNLFGLTRQVNSQLYNEPVWQGDGTTGTINREIDVAELTKDGPAELTLFVAATNVGDSLLATSVCATISPGEDLAIESVRPTSGTTSSLAALVIDSTKPSTKVFSIPNLGGKNTYAATFDVVVTPDAKAVNQVIVEVLDADSRIPIATGPILDITSGIERVDDKTLRVPVTMTSGRTSTVGAPPPQASRIVYRFTVKSTTAEASRDSSVWKALWEWPGDELGIGRYSVREAGGDTWSSWGMYHWIEDNADFLKTTYVNDISGEHGRNLGHPRSHKAGLDVDVFHFTVYSKTLHGTGNYMLLQDKVLAAIGGDATAKTEVTTFFTTARTQLDKLLDMSEVRVVIFGIGDPRSKTDTILRKGWMQSLLLSGKVFRAGGVEVLNIGSTWPGSPRLLFDSVHNHHVHISLKAEADN